MTMQFEIKGRSCELKGIQANNVSLWSMEKMESVLNKHTKGGDIQMYSLQLSFNPPNQAFHSKIVMNGTKETNVDPWLEIINAFEDVFQLPTELPQVRRYDHRIILKEGTRPISQRPYRYPAIQKDVIEKTTQELLESGIIRDSRSSFAAPVVLVKKKTANGKCV